MKNELADNRKKVRVNRELAAKRYRYHKALDKKFFKINGPKRLIDCRYRSFEDIPVGPRYYVGQLIEMGYNVQYKLL